VSRLYSGWSIDQIGAEFERAQDCGDKVVIEKIADELDFRTTSKARALRELVTNFLGEHRRTRKEQSEVSGKTSQPPQSTAQAAPKRSTSPGRLKPTEEQHQAIEQFKNGGSLKINAYAGTGKTSTLELLAHSTARSGQYIAFNRNIVRDAKEKFPSSVNCSTTHGLAFRATPSGYKHNSDKMTGRLSANQLAELLKLKRWQIDRQHVLQPRSQGYLVIETLRRFMQSADVGLEAKHVPRHGSLVTASEPTMNAVKEFALHAAKYLWDRMRDQDDHIPLGHDGYLKLWALSDPVIAADFILLDEAQDTNPVVLDVLRKQRAQMIYVGDKYQQIYEWRGAVNAMENMETRATTYLTTSFRFGPTIAMAASKLLARLGEKRPIRGNPAIDSRIGHVTSQTILARTNASTIAAIIETLDAGKRPHLVGGTDDVMEMLRGAQDLKAGQQSTVPAFFGFDKWEQVVEFAKSGEGDALLSFVNLVESRGERQLMWALNRTVDEEQSDVTISTAHKAKGREWKTVRLMDDFLRSQPKRSQAKTTNGDDPAELRLLYVALTRAREVIYLPPSILSIVG
jgi:superfamily I DNA/RNA helicase